MHNKITAEQILNIYVFNNTMLSVRDWWRYD